MNRIDCFALRLVVLSVVLLLVVLGGSPKTYAASAKMPPSIEKCASEPIKYVGGVVCDKHYYDGRLRHAVGVHSYQAMRSNRTKPPEGGIVGWTYNHGPNLAYWKGRFYLQCLSQRKEEYVPPGRTLIMISDDGHNWSNPRVLFPKYALPKLKGDYGLLKDVDLPAGTFGVTHHRMGFYIAPNGRLLTLGFYSFCKSLRFPPQQANGLGRVVREVYEDGTLGPIYFIRYNRHSGWNESNTNYPFYKQSTDKGFLDACRALLADKLKTLAWWEEDRGEDGFYTIDNGDRAPESFNYCHRPDGVVLGVWKNRLAALSPDNGETWTKIGKNTTLMTCGAKTWVQKTDDSLYALVYNHTANGDGRYPMVIMTSQDCYEFDDILCLNGEVPPIRYQGIHKNIGTQYVRGILEENGSPPGDHIWNVYSVNKEDIWVSRTAVPIRGVADKHFSQDFQNLDDESELSMWNLYVPRWAPISVVTDPAKSQNKCLELRDEEPYDYAIAQRAFPESKKVTVEFRVLVDTVGHGILDVEVQDKRGYRPTRLRFDAKWLSMDRGKTEPHPLAISTRTWLDIRMELDCNKQAYALYVDGKQIYDNIAFGEKVETVERLVFRTGPWRGDVRSFIVDAQPGAKGLYFEDLLGADDKSALSVYLVDDVMTK